MIKGEAITLPRRFYREAAVAKTGSGFAVTLDGRSVKTPAKAALEVPTAALAGAIVQEWANQAEHIDPHTMPLTRLANVAIDRTPLAREEMAAMIAKYGETDLLCHRAMAPDALVQRQTQAWDGPLTWAREALNVPLVAVPGVVAHPQAPEALTQIASIALRLDDYALTGLAHATGLTGSVVLGLCIAHRAHPTKQDLFAAAALEELWSLETWGQDDDLEARIARVRLELAALEVWFAAVDIERPNGHA
jgi:chaperone required for assembly of F1-ATPase